MKANAFLFIFFSLLILTGCSISDSQDHIVAQTAIQYEPSYTFSIVQTGGYSTRADDRTSYTGTFNLLVQNGRGTVISHQSLNQFFNTNKLCFDGTVNLITGDYNNDRLFDIPIGFPAGDGSDEFKYVIFSVGKDGSIFSLPGKGYKDEGFVYTAADSHSTEFTRTVGIGQGALPGILIGVAKNGGGFEPAKYAWDGEQFKFEKDSPFIITQAQLNAQGGSYPLTIIQTEYKKPLIPQEPGFSLFESMYRGRFELLVKNGRDQETSRVPLNRYFKNEDLGFMGTIPLVFRDYNQDGDADFSIGRPAPGKNNPEFQYVLLSVNSEGMVYNLPAVGYKEDGFIYSAETQAVFPVLDDEQTGIEVELSDLNGYAYAKAKYLWNGSKFVFSIMK